jgi:hypothetical protein
MSVIFMPLLAAGLGVAFTVPPALILLALSVASINLLVESAARLLALLKPLVLDAAESIADVKLDRSAVTLRLALPRLVSAMSNSFS